MRHMADGGKRLAPEPISRNARQVPELPQLARGEPGEIADAFRPTLAHLGKPPLE